MLSNSTSCQELQSCVNSPVIPKHDLSFSCSQNHGSDNPKKGPIWSFAEALTNTSYYNSTKLTNESEQVYIHKHSTSLLSSRSLEMCTETLGSENGSSIDQSLDEYSYLDFNYNAHSCSRILKPKTGELRKKIKYSSNFPPPLTSINGGNGFRAQETCREGGRLVMRFSACRAYFKAERGNGRLRLSLLKDYYKHSDQMNAENGLGGKIGSWESCSRSWYVDGSGSKKLPSLPVCVAFS